MELVNLLDSVHKYDLKHCSACSAFSSGDIEDQPDYSWSTGSTHLQNHSSQVAGWRPCMASCGELSIKASNKEHFSCIGEAKFAFSSPLAASLTPVRTVVPSRLKFHELPVCFHMCAAFKAIPECVQSHSGSPIQAFSTQIRAPIVVTLCSFLWSPLPLLANSGALQIFRLAGCWDILAS